MSVISMKQLLEAGVHFGHQTRRWNPKMAEYIFTERNGIYIIDLQKTVKKIDEAYNFVRDIVTSGGEVLFVGTKKQAQEAISEDAGRVGMHFVSTRWLGGMLTNFKTIRKRIDRLYQLQKMEEDGTFDLLTKKEVLNLRAQKDRLEKYLGGIKEMKKLPGVMFIVDPRKERIAIAEARKLNIPIVAIVDTNCDPEEVDYVIPGNDDAIRAVKLIVETIANAVVEGKQGESLAAAKKADDAEQAKAPALNARAAIKQSMKAEAAQPKAAIDAVAAKPAAVEPPAEKKSVVEKKSTTEKTPSVEKKPAARKPRVAATPKADVEEKKEASDK